MNDKTLDYPLTGLPPAGQWVEVAPGVRWVRMPLPFALDHINLWLIEDGPGWAIVDTGFALDEVKAAWEAVLAGLTGPVTRIVVTHFHPDHLGLADWLMARTGAPLYMSHGEFVAAHAVWHQLPGHGIADMLAQFRQHGLDEARLTALAVRGNAYGRGVPAVPVRYRRLHDGDTLRLGAHDWRVIVGLGHSPEHVSLHCEALGLLIAGDMLLPRISTNVSVWAAAPQDDPLGRFLGSLDALGNLPANTLVLPSHGLPFKGLRARIEQLGEHHRERCAALLAALDDARSAGDLLATLFSRPLDTHQVMFAMGEAIAHLNRLVCTGDLRPVADAAGVVRFQRTNAMQSPA